VRSRNCLPSKLPGVLLDECRIIDPALLLKREVNHGKALP